MEGTVMMSVFHLIWIIPLVGSIAYVTGVLMAGIKEDDYHER